MEASTIAAILIGAIAGGTLADWDIRAALAAVAACYTLAAIANLFIPRIMPVRQLASKSLGGMLRNFVLVVRKLGSIHDARFSIAGTSLFWGAGSTMRFLLIAWVPAALMITNNRVPAYLNGVVAIGIIVGAASAAKFVTIDKVNRALGGGILLGIAVCALSVTSSLPVACGILILVGASGGFLVVPFNALLQETGNESVGAGQAIAVQNLVENTTMLLMIGIYTLLERGGVSVTILAAGFGAFLSLAIAALWIYRVRRQRERSRQAPKNCY
jgi:LPLT family lysophospholipid transporter-like MFS transporter